MTARRSPLSPSSDARGGSPPAWTPAPGRAPHRPSKRLPPRTGCASGGELEDARQMRREALQAVVASFDDHLLRARITLHGLAVVEHFVAGFHDQEIALRREALRVEAAP